MRCLSLLLLLGLTSCTCPGEAGLDAGVVDAGEFRFTSVVFGSVLRGDAIERTATFTNTTSADVRVGNIAVSGAGFTLVGPSSLVVPALGEATLTIRFAPIALGRNAGTLVFETPLFKLLELLGEGAGPSLTLGAAELDLGTLPLYDGFPTTSSAELSVRNDGRAAQPQDTALQVVFEVESTSSALPEELCVGDCGSPLRLEAGRMRAMPVTLTTTTAGLKTWDVRVLSNDPEAPMRTVAVKANVVARPLCRFAVPSSIDFGVLTAPEVRELELVFENVGTEVCEVSGVELASPTLVYSLVNPPTTPQSVAPGELLRLLVRASAQDPAPAIPQVVNSEVRFVINHPDQYARVPLTTELEDNCLVITPSPVDFAAVQTACRSAERTVTMRNKCSTAIVVTGVSLPGPSPFSFSAQVPTTLAPRASMTLTTRYAPGTLGPARDVLGVSYLFPLAMISKRTTISLLGEGSATGVNTDRFPPRGTQLDLLIALADSNGMGDKQARLRAQLPGLLTALQNLNVDFRIGVITASPLSGGLRSTTGGLKWLTPSTPAIQARLDELTAFTGHEGTSAACEEPVLRALTGPFVSDPLINNGFLRPGASLEVLCITDTSDVATRLGEVLRLKSPGEVTVDVIGPVAASTSQCSTAWVSSMSGLATYAERTGGQLLDVCAADFTSLFAGIAAQSVERTFFPLRSTPDAASAVPMEVRVNGAQVPSTVWSYESGPNAVRLPVNSGAANANPVEISYPVPCAP